MDRAFAFEEAAVGILTAIAGADGELSQEEIAWWRRIQDRHPLFADLPASIFNPMLQRAQATLSEMPWEIALARWAQDIPPQHSELIYSLGVRLADIDGDISGGEPLMLVLLARLLGIPDARARQIEAENMH